jgi:hypothetical protein
VKPRVSTDERDARLVVRAVRRDVQRKLVLLLRLVAASGLKESSRGAVVSIAGAKFG